MENNNVRLFIGIPLPDEYSKKILKLTEYLDDSVWRKTKEHNLHITALFVGEVDETLVPYIEEIVGNVVERIRPISFTGGREIIMQPDQPTMLWIKFDRSRYYENLVSELRGYFKKIGTWQKGQFKDKTPIAHITLARIKGGGMLDSLIPPLALSKDLESFTARKMVLYKVVRDKVSGESEYESLFEFDLSSK